MTMQITDGEIAAICFIRSVRANAPAPVKSKLEDYIKRTDWSGLTFWAQPILPKLKLDKFSGVEVAEVALLTVARQDVYQFLRAIDLPAAVLLKEKIDRLREWGGWESIAMIVQNNPKIPFHFTADDIRAVVDPTGKIPTLTHSQIQAKTFLNTVATNPKLEQLKDSITKMREWGGWESIAKIVQDNPKIPFEFSGADVKAVLDASGQIAERAPDEIDRLLKVWSFYSALQKKAGSDANVQKFFADITQRIERGCWNSIADIVNKNDKIPFKGFTVPDLKTVLDPGGKYGDDPACASMAPPPPPAWIVPIAWTMQAGKDVADWTEGAANDVADWTEGAANDVADWTTGAVNDVGNAFKSLKFW